MLILLQYLLYVKSLSGSRIRGRLLLSADRRMPDRRDDRWTPARRPVLEPSALAPTFSRTRPRLTAAAAAGKFALLPLSARYVQAETRREACY